MTHGSPDWRPERNIKTINADNIIIDKLIQTAYTERQSNITNRGDTASWTTQTGVNRRGKFFPRGCRGFINTIDVYCRDNAAAGGTITVYISPHPIMGYIATATITVPASGVAAWRSATFNKMWNYDSMFIFVVSSVSDVEWGVDNGTPQDGYVSSDSGATWLWENWRHWFRVAMKGETIGDIPVSGTINAVPIPNVAGALVITPAVLIEQTIEKMLDIAGVGKVKWIYIRQARLTGDPEADVCEITITVDGNQYMNLRLSSLMGLVNNTVNTPTPITIILKDDTPDDREYIIWLKWEIPFQQSFVLTLKNVDEVAGGKQITVYVAADYDLLK